MYLSIILLPLLGAILSGFFGRKLGKTGAQFISTSSVGLAAIFSLIAFYEVALCYSPVKINLIN